MKKINSIKIKSVIDECPDLSHLESKIDVESKKILDSCRYTNEDINHWGWDKVKGWIDEDHAHLASYGRNWYMMGIFAEAEIHISISEDNKDWSVQTLNSGGLWGIENNTDSAHIMDVSIEEVTTLRDILKELGFTLAEINLACEGIEYLN